jgi:hypothetical protein
VTARTRRRMLGRGARSLGHRASRSRRRRRSGAQLQAGALCRPHCAPPWPPPRAPDGRPDLAREKMPLPTFSARSRDRHPCAKKGAGLPRHQTLEKQCKSPFVLPLRYIAAPQWGAAGCNQKL